MPGDFYFLKDKFYSDFPDCGLMPNKNASDIPTNSRPCFFAFQDKDNSKIYWFVPISSRIEKYEALAEKKIDRYGKCDTLEFGDVLGQRRAFLIQNMFPATRDYIADRYLHNDVVVQTDKITANSIIKKAEEVLQKSKRGLNLAFTDINKIYSTLLKQIKEKERTASHVKEMHTEKVEVEPLRVYKQTDKAVLVKLPGKTAGEKVSVWLPNEGIMLDRERAKVIGVREDLQQRYSLRLPQGQPKRFLK